jgi:competence protein ComEA
MSLGYFFSKNLGLPSTSKIEVLDASGELSDNVKNETPEFIVEISGEVEKPGVYKLPFNSRIDDLLIVSGGLSSSADREWVDANINRAAKLSDGQKLYIPKVNQILGTSLTISGGGIETGLVNINTADAKLLDNLSGIGPVYANNIIEHRPYSNTLELVSKGAIPNNVYLKIKEEISCY